MTTAPSRSSAGLAIRVLGPLDVRVDGHTLVVDTRKALAIMALLAVEGRPFARDELAAMLWPDADDASARGSLRRTLSVLRAGLGDRWLAVGRAAVALEDKPWIDLAELATLARSDDHRVLARAAELARGPLLAGFSLRDSVEFDDWRASQGSAVERLVAGLLDRLADRAEASGALPEALAATARRIDLDPLDESAHRRRMRLLARSGDRAGAIRQYRAAVAILERELGVPPLAETTAMYEAISDGTGERAPAPPEAVPPRIAEGSSAVARLPLVGRQRELDGLLSLHASIHAAGRLAIFEGEAGIGKTRLGEELVARIRAAGGTAITARAWTAESSIAYGPVIELLRIGLAMPGATERLGSLPEPVLAELSRLVPLSPSVFDRRGLSPSSPDALAARARLLDAIAASLSTLVGASTAGVVLVEDLQWADEASREALLYLARRLDGRRLLLVLTWRPDDLDTLAEGFAARCREVPGSVVTHLERLGRPEVRALVGAAATPITEAEVERLVSESEGLPLYVVEALAGGPMRDGPRGMRALLRERLSGVGETAGQVLAAAAVIGRSFDLAGVRAVAGRPEEETIAGLDELLRRGLIRERADRDVSFDFAHGKLREAAYDSISLARRRLLHARASEALRARAGWHDDPERLVLVAGHEQSAGRFAEAAEAYRDAGFRAREVYAHHEAATAFEAALGLGHPDVYELQLAIGDARTAEGDYVAAISAFEAAAGVATGDALPVVEMRLGQVHARRGDLSRAASHLDAAVAGLASSPDATLARRALLARSLVAVRAGDLEVATETARRALDGAEAGGDAAGAGVALRTLGLIAHSRGDLDGARTALTRSLALAGAEPDPTAAIAAGNALALVEAAQGDLEPAIARLRAALEAVRRTGDRHLEAAIENNLADQLHAAGRADEAMDHLKRAVALFAEVGGRPGELEPEIWKLVAW